MFGACKATLGVVASSGEDEEPETEPDKDAFTLIEDPETNPRSTDVQSCFWARAGSNHIGNFLFSVISGFSVFGRMELVDMAI